MLADTSFLNARSTRSAGVALELLRNTLHCADGSAEEFDLVSIDNDLVPALGTLPGAQAHALPVRPIELFVADWPPPVDHMPARCRRLDLVIFDAMAADTRLAFVIRQRAADVGRSRLLGLTLIGARDLLMAGAPGATRGGSAASRGTASSPRIASAVRADAAGTCPLSRQHRRDARARNPWRLSRSGLRVGRWIDRIDCAFVRRLSSLA